MSEASRLGCAQPGHKLHFPVGFLGQLWALLPSAGSVLFQDPGSPWALDEGEWLAVATSPPFLQGLEGAPLAPGLRARLRWWLLLFSGSHSPLCAQRSVLEAWLGTLMNVASWRLRAFIFFLFWVCLFDIQGQIVPSRTRPYLGWSLRVSTSSGTSLGAWHLDAHHIHWVWLGFRDSGLICDRTGLIVSVCSSNTYLETSTELFHRWDLKKIYVWRSSLVVQWLGLCTFTVTALPRMMYI